MSHKLTHKTNTHHPRKKEGTKRLLGQLSRLVSTTYLQHFSKNSAQSAACSHFLMSWKATKTRDIIFSYQGITIQPSKMPSSLITTSLLSLLVLWTTVNGQCVDNEDRFEFRNKQGNLKSRKCVWAQQQKTARRCTQIEEVASNCPNTCDTDCLRSPLSATGCRDSPYEFQLIAGKRPHKLCTWASARNTALRCSKFPTKLYCPLTCESCDSEPSVSPTLSPQPSKSPTELPSSKPSLSIVPTKAVSSVPSSSPTFICNDAIDKFFVHAPVGANKPCDPWVKRNPEHRCGMTAGLSTSVGVVSDFCPVTCGLCPDAPSAKPSLSPPPSLKPSVEPSSGPTFSSGEPSATKSQSPSDEPSLVPSDTPSEKVCKHLDNIHDIPFIF